MTDQPSRRSCWKRKRWWAAAALWLAIPFLYPLSAGPVAYCVGRGWLTRDSDRWYCPVYALLERWPPASEAFARHYVWPCHAYGFDAQRAAGSD